VSEFHLLGESIMTNLAALEARLKRVEDRDEIRSLVARYCTIIDNRDMAALRGVFTPDVSFGSTGSSDKIEGRDAVVAYYQNRFNMMSVSNHFTHDQIIEFESDDLAHGHVNAHVEMILRGTPTLVALRYEDTYVRHEGSWKFKERITAFFYYLKTVDYLSLLGDRRRVFLSEDPIDADWPEGIATWQAYNKSAD
jgi:ketosteroid isomerase-like protein